MKEKVTSIKMMKKVGRKKYKLMNQNILPHLLNMVEVLLLLGHGCQ